MTPDLTTLTAFPLGMAAGFAITRYWMADQRKHVVRAMRMAFEAGMVPPPASAYRESDAAAASHSTAMAQHVDQARRAISLTPPDPARAAAGRKGAAVTNERRADSARAHRKRVLEVAEEIRRCLADKNGGAA